MNSVSPTQHMIRDSYASISSSSQRDTAHCNAVQAQSGTDVMVPLIP